MEDAPLRLDTANWIAASLYDLETARHMLATERYLYVIFMCHLALEKMLKTHVSQVTQDFAPRTHDLIFLLRKAALTNIPEYHLDFIGKINNASVPTRYPDDLQRVIQIYSKSVAEEYLTQTKEVLEWLEAHPNLQGKSTQS